MKAGKWILTLVLAYAGIVVAFESLIGFFQPAGQGTLAIVTSDDSGELKNRVLARIESDGKLYVAANHWPRAWYNRALENPQVQVKLEESTKGYIAVPVSGEEHDRVNEDHGLGIGFRILTGFPPRYFLRLDPR